MWAGRFSKQVDAGVNAFNSSIAFDGRMYRHDIQGSIAHPTMPGDCGILTTEEIRADRVQLRQQPFLTVQRLQP